MHISVLTTTRGRLEPLARLLDSLDKQEDKDFSLLLGDQNPEGFLDPLLARYAETVSVRRVRLAPCSLSAARNQLLPQARGEYLALADDDCHYAPDALAQVRRYAQAAPGAGALVGTANAVPGPAPSNWGMSQPLSRFAVFSRAPSWCLFLRREAARTIGGFDETLGIGAPSPWQSGEETDFLLRLLAAGFPIYRAPGIRVFHKDDECNREKIRAYGMGRMRLLAKHGFPLWFRLANVAYPLLRLPFELHSDGLTAVRQRMAMFQGRWEGLWKA